jgi:hypothetical protein
MFTLRPADKFGLAISFCPQAAGNPLLSVKLSPTGIPAKQSFAKSNPGESL